MRTRGVIRIGISGWTYKEWRSVFYPSKLPHKEELPFAAGCFDSIESNGTFYRLQRPENFARWSAETPDEFVFAIKGPRYITRVRRLRDCAAPLANFFASGLLRLGSKLGPILWQLPPNFAFDAELLGAFLESVPFDTGAAAALARTHDSRFQGRTWTEADQIRPLRHAFEIRHDSFRDPAFTALLRAHGVALVCADTVSWPRLMDLTADFAYVRLHGSEELYASGYDEASIEQWAVRVVAWASGREPEDAERIGGEAPAFARDVFVYFDNDAKVRAPVDAQALRRRVESLRLQDSSWS